MSFDITFHPRDTDVNDLPPELGGCYLSEFQNCAFVQDLGNCPPPTQRIWQLPQNSPIGGVWHCEFTLGVIATRLDENWINSEFFCVNPNKLILVGDRLEFDISYELTTDYFPPFPPIQVEAWTSITTNPVPLQDAPFFQSSNTNCETGTSQRFSYLIDSSFAGQTINLVVINRRSYLSDPYPPLKVAVVCIDNFLLGQNCP